MSQVPQNIRAIVSQALEKRAAEGTPVPQESGPRIPGKALVPVLNTLLTSEFVAIHQYTGHYAILKNFGYEKLAKYVLEHLNDERRHTDMLAYRIAFLGGTPEISAALDASLGMTVPQMFANDLAKEEGAVTAYNDSVVEAVNAKDTVTREMLESICKDEDHHIDEITTYQGQIEQMGLGQFLVTQL